MVSLLTAMHPQLKCMHISLARQASILCFVLDESIVSIGIIVEKLMIAYEHSVSCVCCAYTHTSSLREVIVCESAPTSLFTHFNSCQKIKQIQCLTCSFSRYNAINVHCTRTRTRTFSILLNRFLIIVNTSLIVEYIINCSIINHLVYSLHTVLDSDTCRTKRFFSQQEMISHASDSNDINITQSASKV